MPTVDVMDESLIPYTPWWRHQLETFSALLALGEGNPPVTLSVNVFFNLSLNKRLKKQSRRGWYETPSCSAWRHCNDIMTPGCHCYERIVPRQRRVSPTLSVKRGPDDYFMMTSSNGNIFRVTGHLCGEFTGPRWIPHTKASDAELWCLLWSAPE